MSSKSRLAALIVCLPALLLLLSVAPDAQGRRDRHPPPGPRRPVAVRGHVVFIGGYFYDPFFGPYPWWPRTAYPRRYFPIYDLRAELRVLVTPRSTAVYVDGFYAGIVDDFDGVFQSLPLPPGGHDIVLYLEGYRTVRQSLYLTPGSMLKLHETMERVRAGEVSEAPTLAPPIPPPPPGSYRPPLRIPPPRRPEPPRPPQSQPVPSATLTSGTLELHVQPATAEVTIDGQRWLTSDEGHFLVELTPGRHRVEVSQQGYRPLATDVLVDEGETTPLNVSLMTTTP